MRRTLARVGAVGAAILIIAGACAPPTSGPPPLPHADGPMVGVGATGGVIYGENPFTSQGDELIPISQGQAWFLQTRDNGDSWGLEASAGYVNVFAGGAFYRRRFDSAPQLYRGLQISAGYAYASVGAPLARTWNERWTLYTHPALGTTPSESGDALVPYVYARVPAGVVWTGEKLLVQLELSTRVQVWVEGLNYPMAAGALSVGWRF